MNKLNKWIVDRAESIKAKSKKAEDEKRINELCDWQVTNEKRAIVKGVLIDHLNSLTFTLDSKIEHIKNEDEAILNLYSISRSGSNGWDGGPHMLINYVKEEIKSPLFVQIKKVVVDFSYAEEKIDKFIEDRDINYLFILNENRSLVLTYENWYKHLTTFLWKETLGVYKSAYFTILMDNCTFNPIWSLNINSFLKNDSAEGIITEEIWRKEIKLNQDLKIINEERESILKRKKELQDYYEKLSKN